MARIGLIGENSIEYVNHLLDIWNNGDCAVLIDWRIPIATALEMMQEAGVRVCYIETGMDSVTFISIVVEIESYFDIQVPDDYLLINKFRSVAQIMNIIEEELLKKKIGVD